MGLNNVLHKKKKSATKPKSNSVRVKNPNMSEKLSPGIHRKSGARIVKNTSAAPGKKAEERGQALRKKLMRHLEK